MQLRAFCACCHLHIKASKIGSASALHLASQHQAHKNWLSVSLKACAAAADEAAAKQSAQQAPAQNRQYLPPRLPTSQDLMVDHFSELYGAYSDGLQAAKRLAMHCNSKGLSGDIEMEVRQGCQTEWNTSTTVSCHDVNSTCDASIYWA